MYALVAVSEWVGTAVLLKIRRGFFLRFGAVVGSEVTEISNKISAFNFVVRLYEKNDLKFLALKMEVPRYF